MNQTQRKYLIDRLQKTSKDAISKLRDTRLKMPNASNYIYRAMLNDNLKIQPAEVIAEALKQRALAAKEGENWLSLERVGWHDAGHIKIDINSLVVLPDDYTKELARVTEYNKKINEKIKAIQVEADSIEMRVQLASDKTLKSLINTVDDMGDLELVNSTIKSLE